MTKPIQETFIFEDMDYILNNFQVELVDNTLSGPDLDKVLKKFDYSKTAHALQKNCSARTFRSRSDISLILEQICILKNKVAKKYLFLFKIQNVLELPQSYKYPGQFTQATITFAKNGRIQVHMERTTAKKRPYGKEDVIVDLNYHAVNEYTAGINYMFRSLIERSLLKYDTTTMKELVEKKYKCDIK